MSHRHPSEIMVELNKMNHDVINGNLMKQTVEAILKRIREEIEAALNDESLSKEQRRGYQQAWDAWNGHERAINREREEIEQTINSALNRD